MNLKTFTARTMAEALAAVTADLGSDAIILHTRRYKRGGLFGLGARAVVEVTAAHPQDVRRHKQRSSGPSPRAALVERMNQRQPQQHAAPPAARRPEPVRPALRRDPPPPAAEPPNAGDLIRRTYAAARAEFERESLTVAAPVAVAHAAPPRPAPPPVRSQPVVVREPLTMPAPQTKEQLAEEMAEVKRMVARVLRQQQGKEQGEATPRPDMPDQLFDYYLRLIKQELTEELAEEVVMRVRTRLNEEQLRDAGLVKQAMHEAVAALVPVDPSVLQPPPKNKDGRPRVIALVGPTGVGKTTTVAKLAATLKLRHNLRVGLITLDTYRIAAVDQLKTYATIIGVPLAVAMSPTEMKAAVEGFRGLDVVLIDTAGRSQRDDAKLEQLAALVEAANPHEVHLVLSSSASQAVLLEAVERFGRLKTDRIIFTKLDEAVSFGVLLNVMRRANKRLSYVTTGQEVPHQIEPGQATRLAELVTGEAGV